MKQIIVKHPEARRKALTVVGFCLMLLFSSITAFGQTTGCDDPAFSECVGTRQVEYLVKDINALNFPYNYTIGGMEYMLLEIIGLLAVLGAVGFVVVHGLIRYIANKRNPIQLELADSHYIYNIIIRFGHWLNAITIIVLLITGFWMHYVEINHTLGYVHNMAGRCFVVFWLLFLGYEILTFDIQQYIVRGWEIKGGIVKQALFYAIGIFKQEEHPYHMTQEARLNPLQKVAYFSIMFGLMPVLGITGLLLLEPAFMSPIVGSIGMENMKVVFIVHLAAAFGMLAYLLGHLYLATTGDKVSQHYKVMITGDHEEYHRVG